MNRKPGTESVREVLFGRERECALIDAALDCARSGRAARLLLLGEAGIGKSALLHYGAERAERMKVVRVQGREAEADLAFAGLLAVCRPHLGLIESLPERQAAVLRGALALGPAAVQSLGRLEIGASVLSLLSAAAEEQPLLLIVDDANWLDAPSATALLFAARRLDADPVAVLLAAREAEQALAKHGLDEMPLEGLDDAAAQRLLLVHDDLPQDVVGRLVETSQGNPLALLELPQTLTAEQRSGEAPLENPVRVSERLKRAFAHRALTLGEECRSALLVAAASDTGDVRTIWTALEYLGSGPSTLEAAEDVGLVRVEGGELQFRHPLVRAAVYRSAAASERRRVHAALAETLAGRDEERRAWHMAAAAFGRDEEAARLLEATAGRSRDRSAYAAAADAYERAARLGLEARRGERLAAAADAAWFAGEAARAFALAAEALREHLVPEAWAEVASLQARIELHTGDQKRAYELFVEAANRIEQTHPERAAAMLSEAVSAGIQAPGAEITKIVDRLEEMHSGDPFVELALAQALVMAASVAGGERGSQRLQRSLARLDSGITPPDSPLQHFLAGRAYWVAGRNVDAAALAIKGARRARDGQASGLLPQLLRLVALADFDGGHWTSARAAAAEAAELADELRQTTTRCACLGMLAELESAIGDEEACRTDATGAIEIALGLGLDFYRERAERALGRLHFVVGDLEAAAVQLEGAASRLEASANREMNVSPLPDLVEAYARLGARTEMVGALERLEQLGPAEMPGEAAIVERCRGIAATDESFPGVFLRALELHQADRFPFEVARTKLVFGERLRRAGERRAARSQLSDAAETFEALGASAWLRRARDELRASGLRLRVRDPAERDFLTSREAQIASEVARGRTNREVAAALYLTPKTVEFHLTRIYRKLGVRSRTELVRKLGAGASPESQPHS